jgi:hypothetical protein
MLKAKGFLDKWLAWVAELFNTATSSVLLNGTAGKEFKCKIGVRQGDPLSPLLFAIVADLLQSVINHEYYLGNLTPPFLRIGTFSFLLCNTLMTLFLSCKLRLGSSFSSKSSYKRSLFQVGLE